MFETAVEKNPNDATFRVNLADAYRWTKQPERAAAAYDKAITLAYKSLEVNPKLAYKTEATIAEARRLFAELDRPNVFIKVPATEAGIPAIEEAKKEAESLSPNAKKKVEEMKGLFDQTLKPAKKG